MAEYIKREELRKTLETWRDAHADVDDEDGWELLEDVLRELNAQATADVAPAVRCSDCAFAQDAQWNKKGYRICPASHMEITDDDFCSYGVRKED